MAVINLPIIKGNANYKYSITLNGTIFFLKFQFNNVLDKFTMSLFDQNEDVLFAGRAVVLGTSNLFRGADERIPSDFVFAVDLTETHTEPNFENIGDSVQVVYVGKL